MAAESVNIRKMEPKDILDVQQIEIVSFVDSPWTKETYVHEIHKNQFAHYFVLEKNIGAGKSLNLFYFANSISARMWFMS